MNRCTTSEIFVPHRCTNGCDANLWSTDRSRYEENNLVGLEMAIISVLCRLWVAASSWCLQESVFQSLIPSACARTSYLKITPGSAASSFSLAYSVSRSGSLHMLLFTLMTFLWHSSYLGNERELIEPNIIFALLGK